MDKVKQWNINHTRTVLVHEKLGEMIALDCQPLSIVGFSHFVKALEPWYVENIFFKYPRYTRESKQNS